MPVQSQFLALTSGGAWVDNMWPAGCVAAYLVGAAVLWGPGSCRPRRRQGQQTLHHIPALQFCLQVICAGCLDTFQICVWSVRTGRLLDILAGHEGPVCGLAFTPAQSLLASASWDKTVRTWDVFR